jgi:hypothetical protein
MIVLDTLRRMFGDVRPIDWAMLVVELLVLLLVAYEVIEKLWKQGKEKRMTKAIVRYRDAGQALRTNVPAPQADEQFLVAWQQRVTAWTQESYDGIGRYSAHAASCFLYPPSRMASQHIGVHAGAQDYLSITLQRLEVLRGIVENASAYV